MDGHGWVDSYWRQWRRARDRQVWKYREDCDLYSVDDGFLIEAEPDGFPPADHRKGGQRICRAWDVVGIIPWKVYTDEEERSLHAKQDRFKKGGPWISTRCDEA